MAISKLFCKYSVIFVYSRDLKCGRRWASVAEMFFEEAYFICTIGPKQQLFIFMKYQKKFQLKEIAFFFCVLDYYFLFVSFL